jgi:uncharacterized protein (DUF488 family)
MQLYTVGYEGTTFERFVFALRAARVERLVDVRERPQSRKAGFSRTALARGLADAGIEYRHVRELGCPKVIRDRYRSDDDWAGYTRDFLAYLETQPASVRQVAELATERPTALLCFEADPARCHRRYVAEAAAALMPLHVEHLAPPRGGAAAPAFP